MISPQKLIQLFVIILCLFITGTTSIYAEEEKKIQAANPFMPYMPGMSSVPSMESMNYAIQKTMDPNTMVLLMSMMMNPKDVTAEGMCAACHTGEDIARYQTLYGPMLEGMWQPFKAAMNPATYMGMMGIADPTAGEFGSVSGSHPMFNPAMWMYPTTWMNPGNYMSLMNPMTWMNAGNYMQMMNPMAYMGMMTPMMGGYGYPMGQTPGTGQAMNPEQYEQWFNQWTDMMQNFMPPAQQNIKE